MLKEIHQFLSSSEHTGYQTIFIGIITSVSISLLIINVKFICNLIKYVCKFIKKILGKCFGSFGKHISYNFRLINVKKLTYEEVSELQKKSLNENIQMSRLESKALKKYMKDQCIHNKLNLRDIMYLQDKKNNGMQLESFELFHIQKVEKQINEMITKNKEIIEESINGLNELNNLSKSFFKL